MHKYIISLLIFNMTVAAVAQTQTDEELLAGADARIHQHRMGDLTLVVRDAEGNPLPADTSVRIEQTRHAFRFGCGIFKYFKDDKPPLNTIHEQYFADLFNYVTIGTFWWWFEPEQDKCRYERTEHFIRWARDHEIEVQGSPVAWNFMDPSWMPDDPDACFRLQMDRIEKLLTRYRGRISSWILLNEATHVDREDRLKQAPKLVAMVQHVGLEKYMKKCFEIARKTDPDAELVINDYRHDPAFEDVVLKKLVDEQDRPLYDVIGLQSHQHRGLYPLTYLWEVCERFGQYGKPLHWSEMTLLSGQEGWYLADNDPDFDWTTTPAGEKKQAEAAVRQYTLLFSHPAVTAITWWQLSDRWTWMEAPAGLLRRDFTPKPAYHALHKLIKEDWWTKTTSQTDADSRIAFRGFYGDYKITAERKGRVLAATFTLTRDHTGPITVRLASDTKK